MGWEMGLHAPHPTPGAIFFSPCNHGSSLGAIETTGGWFLENTLIELLLGVGIPARGGSIDSPTPTPSQPKICREAKCQTPAPKAMMPAGGSSKMGTSLRRHHERAPQLSQFLNLTPSPPTQWADNSFLKR